MSLKISFTKMCGAGNDFLITDSTRVSGLKTPPTAYFKEKAPQFCHRRFGLGADGVCFLSSSPSKPFQWLFLNSDGSLAQMCGNAACCIIHYAYKKNLISQFPFVFQIQDKILKGEIKNKEESWLHTTVPQFLKQNISEDIEGQKIMMDFVDSGVPHILIKSPLVLESEKLRTLAKKLRKKYPDFNITFYNSSQQNQADCCTFERGVEDFTLSCGTGVLATALQLGLKNHQTFFARMKGGTLKVVFEGSQAYLHSPVHWIAETTPYEL